MPQEITILDNPQLPQSSDYAYLRSKGLEYIEKLGSRLWTDYNIHDPGITLLELLSYAISDLGYRANLDTKDILAANPDDDDSIDPKLQAFFTARDIMTVNPLTQADYRKLLIDVDGIRNGWMQCKSCGCGDHYLYADCKTSRLQYETTEHRITLKGMYDVLVEFEDEEGVGDLNNGKIKYSFPFTLNGGKLTNAVIEMRLPSWHEIEALADNPDSAENVRLFNSFKLFRDKETSIESIDVTSISGNRGDNTDTDQQDLGNTLRKPVYVTMKVVLVPENNGAPEDMWLYDVPATLLFHNDEERKTIDMVPIRKAILDMTPSGIIARYADRIRKADDIIGLVRDALQSNRNLCEDYCSIKAIETEEISLCADIDVASNADIEKVLAQAYYLADQYMSTDIKFYSLKELLDAGKTTDEIFDGPALSNGFIDNDQLESTQLKTVLHSSDLINLIMDIPGVTAVRNFTLIRYDRDGNRSEAQSWSMDILPNHQPRLYLEGSKLVAYKNGLPFLPDKLELSDTLQIIKGQNIQPKYSLTDLDMAVPEGTYYPLTEYYPLQYSLPITYGVGEAGLPATATAERRAQAKQLKAYLLFFEQMLVNYLEQLSHVKDFFSLDQRVDRSYYTKLLVEEDISGVIGSYIVPDSIVTTEEKVLYMQNVVNSLAENESTFLDRRNRFLDHLLSRFAEQFTDYTLMVYSYSDNVRLADQALIKDKIAFLQDYPFISSNRARAYNYKDSERICNRENVAGLQRRIERLLGFKGLAGYISFYEDTEDPGYYRWHLVDANGEELLIGNSLYLNITPANEPEEINNIVTDATSALIEASSYTVVQDGQWVVKVATSYSPVFAIGGRKFNTEEEAQAFATQIVDFIKTLLATERICVMEHLLLRPRVWTPFIYTPKSTEPDIIMPDGTVLHNHAIDGVVVPADTLLPICIPPDCNTCGEEDPYSFRMSIIMNGAEGIAASNMEFRRFAEETIRMETPAHIALKICWVSTGQLSNLNDAFCAWQRELAKESPDPEALHNLLGTVISQLVGLENVYPPARLHDCAEGSEESRVFLNHTTI